MDLWLYPTLAALAVMCVSLVGVIFSARTLSEWFLRHLTLLASFSMGVFGVVIYHLLEEALHEADSPLFVIGAVILGAALIEVLHRLLPDSHHHHDLDHDHEHSTIDARRVLVSDSFHNIGDGVLLVGAFATNLYVGIAATVGVLVHEVVQEVSEYFVLREAGLAAKAALVRNFIASSTILIGVVVAALLSESHGIAALLSGLAAGGFLIVIARDLLPNAFHTLRNRGRTSLHIAAIALGVVVMLSVQTIVPHEDHEGVTVPRSQQIIPSI